MSLKTVSTLLFVLVILGPAFIPATPSQAGTTIRIDALVVTAANLDQAENKARHQALDRALTMLGNRKIPDAAKEQVHREAGRLVTIRRVLNKKPRPDGSVKPVFFCSVSKTGIMEIINRKNQSTLKSMDRPQVNIGIIFRTLPPHLNSSRKAFLDRINNLLEEYFSAGGFRIAPPPEAMLKAMAAGKSTSEVFKSFVHNSTEVNYLLYGALDVNPEDIRRIDGRYYKSRVGLTLRFYNIPSHDIISFSRDVYGTGENEKTSVSNAMRNCAKVISEKVGINEVVADWQRKLNEGFEYSLQFCGFHDHGWSRILRRALKQHGRFISRSRGRNLTRIYRYKADPGMFLHPSVDFEDFLEDLEGLEEVRFGLMVQNDRLYYVFGDDEQCFDIGFDNAEDALK